MIPAAVVALAMASNLGSRAEVADCWEKVLAGLQANAPPYSLLASMPLMASIMEHTLPAREDALSADEVAGLWTSVAMRINQAASDGFSHDEGNGFRGAGTTRVGLLSHSCLTPVQLITAPSWGGSQSRWRKLPVTQRRPLLHCPSGTRFSACTWMS
jgi:hypothetical protein